MFKLTGDPVCRPVIPEPEDSYGKVENTPTALSALSG